MYNQNIPTQNELPSTKQLIKSTVVATVVAIVVLVTSILPAEYGIDPTGVGRVLGLVEMAEIKQLLAEEERADQQSVLANVKKTVPIVESISKGEVVDSTKAKQEIVAQTDIKVFILKPGQAAEIKLAMNKDELVDYQWVTTAGNLNFDTHGDSDTISYHGYGKGRNVDSDKGSIKAAFDGSHGWFWRNRSKQNVEVTLTTEGQYSSIKRVL